MANDSEILLKLAQAAHNTECERRNVVDTKAGIALPIAISYELILLSSFNLHDILLIEFESFKEFLLPCGLFTFYVAALFLGFTAIVFGSIVLKPTKYQVVLQNENSDFYKGNQNEPLIYSKLCNDYYRAAEYNKFKNDRKFKLFNAVWTLIIISLACYIIYIALQNIYC